MASLDFTDPSFAFLSCNTLDPDGRSDDPSRLGFLAGLFGIGKNAPSAKVNISISFTPAAAADIRRRLNAAALIRLTVQLNIHLTGEGDPSDAGPFLVNEYSVSIETATNNIILTELPTNIVPIPLSMTEIYTFLMTIKDETVMPAVNLYTASLAVDPATALPVITVGSVRDASFVLG